MNPIISTFHLMQLIAKDKVVVLYAISEAEVDPKTFADYGKFKKLMAKMKPNDYLKKHITGSIPFDLGIAMFPTSANWALYPANVFQEYLCLLGINNGDHAVIYGNDKFAGMLNAAKVWWLLKYYGLNNVQVLNGGLKAWEKAGYPISSGEFIVKRGNFIAKEQSDMLMTFEQLETNSSNNQAIIDRLDKINFFDGRPRKQFTGEEPLKLNSSGPVLGYRIAGAKNLPAVEVVNENGIRSAEYINKLLKEAGYLPKQQIITSCLTGKQAALITLALASVGIDNVQLYHGSLLEMALRDPARISAK